MTLPVNERFNLFLLLLTASCFSSYTIMKSKIGLVTTLKLGRPRIIQPQSSCSSPRKMVGMTPAWKRHMIQQRNAGVHRLKSKDEAKDSSLASLSSAHPISQESSDHHHITDQLKSFSIGSLAGLLGSLAGMGVSVHLYSKPLD